MIPLNQVPIYSLDSHLTKFWPAARNATEWSFRMKELVLSGNMLTKLLLTQMAPTLKGAHIGGYLLLKKYLSRFLSSMFDADG
jgi:hypothetical protein